MKLDKGSNFKDRFYGKGNYSPQKYNDLRYFGVNFHSIFYRGTLEIRYHCGTTNAQKILNWVSLHQQILDSVVTKEEVEIFGFIEEMKNCHSLSRKLNEMRKFLSLNSKTVNYMKERIGKFEGDKITFVKKLTTKEE
jgi:hypothetical protein